MFVNQNRMVSKSLSLGLAKIPISLFIRLSADNIVRDHFLLLSNRKEGFLDQRRSTDQVLFPEPYILYIVLPFPTSNPALPPSFLGKCFCMYKSAPIWLWLPLAIKSYFAILAFIFQPIDSTIASCIGLRLLILLLGLLSLGILILRRVLVQSRLLRGRSLHCFLRKQGRL